MSAGKKYDAGKPDMTHIPIEAMYAMAEAFTHGAKKYGGDNYREGLLVRRQIAAALRHIYQFLDEGDIDAESGCKHIGSALASLAMAAYTVEKKPEFDDRYKTNLKINYSEAELNIIAQQKFKEE